MSAKKETVTVPTPHGSAGTKRQNAESGFKAPARLRKSMQLVLVDMINLNLVGKQAHWNIVGPNFRDLHLNLDEVVDIARDATDVIAERMRAMHAVPDGRAAVVASQSAIDEFPEGEILTHDAIELVVKAIDTTVATIRDVHDAVDEDDPTSADILHEYIDKLEQQSWFIGAELRTPTESKN
ncbi:Dps family protein [Micrococcoides hystricis]|uniref:Dps family protein n=1 Tax=Micrococcoides hystricis TaxID=1572761 RepID=A0ABV6PAE6_9MICC